MNTTLIELLNNSEPRFKRLEPYLKDITLKDIENIDCADIIDYALPHDKLLLNIFLEKYIKPKLPSKEHLYKPLNAISRSTNKISQLKNNNIKDFFLISGCLNLSSIVTSSRFKNWTNLARTSLDKVINDMIFTDEFIPYLNKITIIDLSCCDLINEDLYYIHDMLQKIIKHGANISVLNLQLNKIGAIDISTDDLNILSKIFSFEQLKYVILSGNNILGENYDIIHNLLKLYAHKCIFIAAKYINNSGYPTPTPDHVYIKNDKKLYNIVMTTHLKFYESFEQYVLPNNTYKTLF